MTKPKPFVNLSVDPGLSGTGFAVWNWTTWKDLEPPLAAGILDAQLDRKSQQKPWVARAYAVGRAFDALLQDLTPVYCYVEWPNFRSGAGGHMCAARGDLGKLYFVCGVLAEVCRKHGCHFVPVGVPEWKGQLSKEMVASRVQARIGTAACKRLELQTHAWDAVGLGLTVKGYM